MGLFDGLHRGHMAAVGELLRFKGEKLVYTFDSAGVFTKGERGLLMSDRMKRERLLDLGVDRVVSVGFSAIKDMTAEEFSENVLFGELSADKIICGENFRFGANASAGIKELEAICKRRGAEFEAVPILRDGGEPVSTTRIRRLIEAGDLEEAERLIGRPYVIEGELSGGGFIPGRGLALPPEGEYALVLGGREAVCRLFEGRFIGTDILGEGFAEIAIKNKNKGVRAEEV